MNQVVAELVAQFEAAARTAQQTEDAARKKMMEEVARLERRRAFAFRRTNLVRALATAAGAADCEEAVDPAQRAAVRRELGWGCESDFHRAILDRLQPVGRRVWQYTGGVKDGKPSAIHAELESFEAWYEATYDNSFYALFDQDIAEVALVEP
jgi:hypothetical protein